MPQSTDLFHLESAVDHLRRAYADGISGADPLEAAQAAGHLGELLHLAGDRLVGAAQILGSFTTEHGLAPATVEAAPSEPAVSAPPTVEARQADFLAPDLADTSDDSVAAVEAQQEMQQQEVIPPSPENVAPQIDARFDTTAATEIFQQMRRGERLSFVDSRGQVDVGELFSRFGIDKNNFVDNFTSELVDVYADYRDGPFADMLPAIQFVDGVTVRTVDGNEQKVDSRGQRVTLNLLSIVSPFGFINNQVAYPVLGTTPPRIHPKARCAPGAFRGEILRFSGANPAIHCCSDADS